MASKRRPARRRPSARPARSKPAPLARVKAREAPVATPAGRPVPVAIQHFPKKPPVSGVMSVEVEPSRVEETLSKFREELSHWAKKGRHTKVRFKLRGKQLLPDIPLAAVVAGEALMFQWG